MSVSQLPARSQQQQGPSQSGPAVAGKPAAAPKAPTQKRGGVLGWMQSAGQWMSEKASSASKAVGDAVETTKQVAKDAWEVAQATDIGWKDGALQVETDLDELLDLVPAHVKAALQLDRAGAENKVKVNLSPMSGLITLSSDALAIGAVNSATLKTGPAMLRGVEIEITRPGGGLRAVDPKKAAGASAVKVKVKAADVRDVRFTGAGGPISVARVELAGFTGDLGSRGGPLSVAGDEGTASLALEKAVITGLRAQGHTVGSLSAEGLSAGLSAGGERAHLSAEALAVKDASSGGQKLGDASVRGARIDLQNQGGGLPMADDKADHLRAKVAVEAAEVHNFDGQSADVRSARAAQIAASFDQDAGDTSVRAAGLSATGLDTAWLDADSAGIDGLDVKLNTGAARTGLHVGADKLSGKGWRADSGAAPKSEGESAPLDWSAKVGEADLTELGAGNVQMGALRGKGVEAAGAADGANSRYGVRAQQVGAEQIRQGDISVADISAIDAAVDGGADRARLSAAALSANDLQGPMLKAGHIRGKGAVGEVGAQGVSASLASGTVRDALVMNRVAIDEANVTGLSAGPANGGRQLKVEQADLSGASDRVSGAKLKGAQLRRGQVQTDKAGGLSGSLDQLRAQELAGFGAGVKAAELNGARFAHKDGQSSGSVAQASLSGATGPQGIKADALQATGLSGQVGPAGSAGAIDQLQGQGLAAAGWSAKGVQAEGLTGASAGGRRSAGARSLAAQQLRGAEGSVGGVQAAGLAVESKGGTDSATLDKISVSDAKLAAGSLKGAEATGLRASRDAGGMSGGLAQLDATGLDVAGLQAGRVKAEGLSASQRGDTRALDLDHLQGNDVNVKAGGAQGSAKTLGLDGLSVGQGPKGDHLGLDGLQATGLRGAAAGNSGSVNELAAQGLNVNRKNGVTDGTLASLDAKGIAAKGGGADASLNRLQLSGAAVHDDAQRRSASLGSLSAEGAKVRATSSGGGGGASGLDTKALAATLAPRINNADVDFSAPLRAGAVPGAPVKVRPGTGLDASVQVRDNRFVPGGTSAALSKTLDGPAWTGVKGAYMNEDGELKADLTGTLGIDMDVGGKINDSLGIRGDALPSLGALGQAYAKQPAAPPSSGPSATDIVDMSHHNANGSVGLSAGAVSAGSAGGATIGRGQRPGDNQVDFESDGQRGAKAKMRRILLDDARAKQGGVEAKAGRTKAEGVAVQQQGNATQAELDALRVEQLSLSQRKG